MKQSNKKLIDTMSEQFGKMGITGIQFENGPTIKIKKPKLPKTITYNKKRWRIGEEVIVKEKAGRWKNELHGKLVYLKNANDGYFEAAIDESNKPQGQGNTSFRLGTWPDGLVRTMEKKKK